MDISKLCPGCMKEIENRDSMEVCPDCGYNLKNQKVEPHQMPPFTILAGKYLIGKVIGEGGFGISYLGMDLNLELTVAIKEFYPNGFVTRESNVTTMVSMYAGKNEADVNKWRDGFINEAKNLAKFSNLNGIVEVRDFFYENGTAYIVMEYVDGITLKQYLKQNGGKIPPDKTFQMMEPVVKSLAKVHDAGIIHRDISPDNIMITKYGGMKLLDFGAARDFAGNAEKSLSIMLKPGYAPEEQYRSRGKQGPWSDVYALSATIYKCITGVTPIESMERMREDTLQSPKELGVKISDAQNSAIKQGMAVYAEQRFQSMDVLHKALYSDDKSHVKEQAVPLPPLPQPEKNLEKKPETVNNNQKPDQKKMIIIGGAAAAAILVIVMIIAIVSMDGGNNSQPALTGNYVENSSPDYAPVDEVQSYPEEVQNYPEEADANMGDLETQINDIVSSISNYQDADELNNVLNRLLELAQTYGNDGNLGEQAAKIYGYYQNALIDRIGNYVSQEPRATLYVQISRDIDAALKLADEFEKCAISVDTVEIENASMDSMAYRESLIELFDSYAENEIRTNGVVSRSELWSLVEGVNNADLSDDPNDPLRLRYAAALTLHVDSEMDKADNAGKIALIRDNIANADYSPYLVYKLREAGYADAEYWYEVYCSLGDVIYFETFDEVSQRNAIYEYYTSPEFEILREVVRQAMEGVYE